MAGCIVAATGVLLMEACSSGERSTGPGDGGVAERVLVSGTMTTEVGGIRGREIDVPPQLQRVTRPVIGDAPWSARQGALDPSAPKTSALSGVTVRHQRGKDGKIYSLAFVSDRAGGLPKRAYAFVDGKILLASEMEYRSVRGGSVRSRSTITTFDRAGKPAATFRNGVKEDTRIASLLDGAQRGLSIAGRTVSRIVLPDVLQAQCMNISDDGTGSCSTGGGGSGDGPGCSTAFLTVVGASGVVAQLMAEMTAAGAACTNGLVAACTLIPPLLAKVSAAIAIWSVALDKLQECRERAVSGGGPLAAESDKANVTQIIEAVRKFIETAHVTCNADGSVCSYS